MFDFEFQNPTRIVFGQKTVARLDTLIPPDARVLVLYGGNSAKTNGTLNEVIQALGSRYIQQFGGIEANPTYETLMRAVEQIHQQKLDFLLAVGGGSVIDGTKFVAAAALYDGAPWEILETRGANISQALPFGSVLTLPATGSEMNNNGVVSRTTPKSKRVFSSPFVFPRFSILDPDKTRTIPAHQRANGVVDAFVHVVEQYITFPVDGMVQDRFAEGLLRTLIEIGPKVVNDPDDAARANLMWVATLALNGLIGAGVPQDWSTHMIGHELTAQYGIDHARTLAVVLTANLHVRREAKRVKLLQYAERVWGITEGTDDQRIDQAIANTQQFFESLGIKTRLSDYGIGAAAIDMLVQQLASHGLTQLGEQGDMTLEISGRVLEAGL